MSDVLGKPHMKEISFASASGDRKRQDAFSAGDRARAEEFKTHQVLSFPNGKMVDEKVDIKPWPSITGFRAWKFSFK